MYLNRSPRVFVERVNISRSEINVAKQRCIARLTTYTRINRHGQHDKHQLYSARSVTQPKHSENQQRSNCAYITPRRISRITVAQGEPKIYITWNCEDEPNTHMSAPCATIQFPTIEERDNFIAVAKIFQGYDGTDKSVCEPMRELMYNTCEPTRELMYNTCEPTRELMYNTCEPVCESSHKSMDDHGTTEYKKYLEGKLVINELD